MQKMALLLAIFTCLLLDFRSNEVAADEPSTSTKSEINSRSYVNIVTADDPIAYWRLGDADAGAMTNQTRSSETENTLDGTVVGDVKFGQPGPRSTEFPFFGADNLAAGFAAKGAFVRVKDPGEKSPFDFGKGDSITLEGWVNPKSLSANSFLYIIGKGRTGNPGFVAENQNFALRLKTPTGALSFLFRSAGKDGDWHRWTSQSGVSAGDGWHHVAVTYTFGKKESVRGYIDGELVKGTWDMGGATDRAPIVDDDEVRIGSSFNGLLDEVAIHRTSLTPERIKARYHYVSLPLQLVEWDKLPLDTVLVDVFEGVANKKSWNFRPPNYVESFTTQAFGFVDLPKKYSSRGILVDRSGPILIRAVGLVKLPKGEQRLLVRSRNASRLFMDDHLVAETAFHNIRTGPVGADGDIIEGNSELAPNIRRLRYGDTEKVALIEGDGEVHRFRFEMIVGGQGHRPELGDTSVSISRPDEDFRLLSASVDVPFTEDAWPEYVREQRRDLAVLDGIRRRDVGIAETEVWNRRHQLAREAILKSPAPTVPTVAGEFPVNNDIDRFISARIEAANVKPLPLIADLNFLRRVTLDVIGTVPTPTQIEEFLNDSESDRRTRAIDRLLEQPGWADNWVGYWQDVLAENPNLITPVLNNSGPFRWWIHESFLDNKPFDRFATELVRMEGGRYFGGPAGFEMAAENDVPMAAKAQIIGRAFLGLNMTCARCHDAPFHDFLQEDLFSLAAMLKRSPQIVPKTSSIPGGDAAVASLTIEVTLKPGSKVVPAWTFANLVTSDAVPHDSTESSDTREQLAALITSPNNKRFARVIVNRMWNRYLGRGLVEMVDDWQDAEPSHPGLLDYLSRELILHDYDLKHITRLILNSHVYQRVARSEKDIQGQDPYLFEGPILRRMSAEQVVDSLFLVSGKRFNAGQLCIDVDGSGSYKGRLNLGDPDRAWQFVSLANERDRPSLSLPFAQPFVTVLETFGWRSARQNPITERDDEPTVLQPAVMANSVLARRITRLSDDNTFTRIALEKQPVERLIERVYLRMLTRKPTATETKLFAELLKEGYPQRHIKDAKPSADREPLPRGLVGWSNHLHPRANEIKVELQRAVEKGDSPTNRLDSDWRQRMEDMIWTLMNSPEFVYLP